MVDCISFQMSLSTWMAGTRALLRLARYGRRPPAPAQKREQPSNENIEAERLLTPVQATAFSVEQEIRSVLGDFAAATGRKPVQLEIAVQPGLMFYGNRAAFHEVLAAVVQHLQILEESGLVQTEKTGRVRTCRVEPAGLNAAARWIEERRPEWDRKLDRLGELLGEYGSSGYDRRDG